MGTGPTGRWFAIRSVDDPLEIGDAGWRTSGTQPDAARGRSGLFEVIQSHWLGWLITAAAVSLGAPFWFDLLNKLVNLRAAGKKPKE